MFKVYWTNFDYFAGESFTTLASAVAYAKSKSFEANIYKGETLVASVSTLGGYRDWVGK